MLAAILQKAIRLQRFVPRFLFIVALLTTALVYQSGLNGPFLFDDGINIVGNQDLRLEDFSQASIHEAAFSIPNGFLRRPLSMLSFALNFYLDRDKVEPFTSAFSFKLTNLVIHLLNGLAVFVLVRLLTALYRDRRQAELSVMYPEWLALAVSTAWLLHPINLTGVLYVVQRMAGLAALFSFVGLGVYLWGRARLWQGQRGGGGLIFASVLIFMPLAVLSKENGVLLPFFILSIELVLFRFETPSLSSRRLLIGFFWFSVVMPALALIGYVLLHPELLFSGYARRDFTLGERLMTEARVVCFYLRLIVMPNISLMGIQHDDIIVSRSIFDPVNTFSAILGVLGLLVSIWVLRRREPLIAFGVLFFAVGHSLESTVIPLEISHEHRNYLPSFGILLVFFHLLLNPIYMVTTRRPRRLLAILLIPLFAIGTASRASDWSSAETLWVAEVRHHPKSSRANTAMGDYYANLLTLDPFRKELNYKLARESYERNISINRYDTSALFGLIRLGDLYGKPVEKAWVSDLIHGLQHASIPSNTNDFLVALASCRNFEGCQLQANEVAQLMQAPLNNSKVTGSDRALIYAAITFYNVNVTHDYQAANEAIRQAIKLSPHDLNLQLWLGTVLISMKRTNEARQQIEIVKRLDTKKTKVKDIDLLEDILIKGK